MKSLLLAALFPVAVAAQEHPDTAHRLVDSLKAGGYVIVFRHAHTDRSGGGEQKGWTMADRSTQRNLSDRGAEESKAIGQAFKALGVPVGEILSSPMFRTKETAIHAFGRADTTELLRNKLSDPASKELITKPVAAGTNRVLVTHNAYFHTFFETLGYMQNGEGDAVIVKPLGDAGFQVLGRIRIADWLHFASPGASY
jgi:phosphohistidine phosphatase SixA